MTPSIGLFGINMYAGADPRGAARVAALAEDLGYDSVWVGDHVVVPSPRDGSSPMEPTDPLLDPLVSLGHLAAFTSRVRLATGCVVLPQRDPLVLAKQLASVDVVSGGRLVFGLAVGYLEAELRALGVPMAARASRTEEYLQAIRSLWYDEAPAFHGRHVDFAGVDAHPRPVQRPVPVVVGGHSPAAHRRAAIHADEWFGFALGLRATREQVAALHAAERAAGRTAPPLRVSVAPARPLDPDVVRSYADLGVDRLVVIPPIGTDLPELEEFVSRNAPARLGARAAGDDPGPGRTGSVAADV